MDRTLQSVLVILVGVILVACALLLISQETISHLNQDITKAQRDLATANRDLLSADECIADLKAQREELHAANETLVERIAELEGNVSALQLKLASLEYPNIITKIAMNYSIRLHISHQTWALTQILRNLIVQVSLQNYSIFVLNSFDAIVEMNDVIITAPSGPILVIYGVAEVHLSVPEKILTMELNGQILVGGVVLEHLRMDLWLVEVPLPR